MAFESFNPCTMLNPTPVVLVSCGDGKGKQNAVTVAWAGTVNSEPPMVSVSIRPERFSHAMIVESGEFVVNLTDEKMAKATDYCGVRSGRNEDKLANAGLHPVAAEGMEKAPALAEAPAYLSCKVRQVIHLGSHDMFIGEVVAVQVRKDLLEENGPLHLERAGLLCYNHGLYQKLGDVLGFFGWSVAKPEVLENRMKPYR